MPRGPRTPLKQGRNGTRSINTQLTDLADRLTAEEGVQGLAVADATDEPTAVTQLNALLASLRTAGLLAT
jgi:hypothetical protein